MQRNDGDEKKGLPQSLENSSLFERCEMLEILQPSTFNLNSYKGLIRFQGNILPM
jgi:hypothetical protein